MASANSSKQHPPQSETDVVVVGGGLAGLTAAAFVARAGVTVQVVEQARHAGGRAMTNRIDGVDFNLGPHALYVRGEAHRALTELKVPFAGHFPNPGRAQVTLANRAYRIPQGIGSLVTSRLLSVSEKMRLARLFGEIKKLDVRQLDRTTVRDWLAATAGQGNLALLLAALIRVSTYVDDIDSLSAGAAVEQLRLALEGNVLYLDGGWQSIVDGLRHVAVAYGATVHTSTHVDAVESLPTGLTVRTSAGVSLRCRATILAVDPDAACQMLELPAEDPLAQWARGRLSVPAACLDVALRQLPRPGDRFALGLDQPMYYSVHSAAAKLGPPGVAVVHVMKYLRHGATPAAEQNQTEIEAFLDRLQPGWRHGLGGGRG